jgi:serine/threonine protein kinase
MSSISDSMLSTGGSPMADRVGHYMGNYRLVRLLGQGGFADVYLGEHLHLGTEAAIKVLATRLIGDELERFRAEARTIARLKHAHIVRVLDFGIDGATPFLVMDYASGGTLRQRHPKGTRLPLLLIVSYVKQVADALQYAHDAKLIHRDIKPENMLLGDKHEVLLSDFGIAVVAQSSRYDRTQDTTGTIAYMAPEQIQAHPRPASDQYALGVVVYEWLSGDCPFRGSFTEIAAKHVLVPPSPLREKMPSLSPAVEQVVLTALAKDPKQRFSSVQAFANALEQVCQPTTGGTLTGQAFQPTSPASSTSSSVPTELVTPPSQMRPHPTPLPSEVSHAPKQGVSRRTVILTLAGLAVAGGGIAWAITASGRTNPLPPPATRSVSPPATASPSPIVYTEGVAHLDYSTDLGSWGINYDRPSFLNLSPTPPASNWVQPASRGIKRFFGILNFGDTTRVNVILDQTTQPNSGGSPGYFDGLAAFTFNNDTDFSNKPTVNVPGTTGASQPVEFTITYASGSQQKYAIEVYTYFVSNSYVLGYYRAAVRQGKVKLQGVIYPLAITDENNDGFYSDLGSVDVHLDLNGDGTFENNEHFAANQSFTLHGNSYLISSITPDGTQMVIQKTA